LPNEKISDKIELWGSRRQIAKAKKIILSKLGSELSRLKEPEARLKIQTLIDEYGLEAEILYDGNVVWSKEKIIRNLKRIIKAGRLYDAEKLDYIPIGSMLKMPRIGKTILSEYFYKFLTLECGSIAHFNIRGWVAEYPTLEDLKEFFKKNEYGRKVSDSIPWWHTDVKRIVEEIEALLFPFRTYLKQRSVIS